MLQSESVSNEEKAIIWSDSGAAFRIVDVHVFSSSILPKYFRTSKFSSFQRNLNLVSQNQSKSALPKQSKCFT